MPDRVNYFPAYEIVNDELRDYRFYAADMLHPSAQAVEFLSLWRPIKEALGHKPFNPSGKEYLQFMAKSKQKAIELMRQYPDLKIDLSLFDRYITTKM